MNVSEKSIWLKYHDFSQLEDIHKFISDGISRLKIKQDEDLRRIEKYDDEVALGHYLLLENEYNHLYAHLLLTISAALEYDLCCLLNLEFYTYKSFIKILKEHKIKKNKIKQFKNVNLLRLYCNAYKHKGGLYTKQIVKIKNEFKENDEIAYSEIDILEQYYFAYEFLFDLYEKLNTRN